MRVFDNDELRRRVDEVLFYVWDPIGVSDEPCARGEYESYVPRILELLVAGDDAQRISSQLASIVSTSMELAPDKQRCDYTAELLLQHKKAVAQGLA